MTRQVDADYVQIAETTEIRPGVGLLRLIGSYEVILFNVQGHFFAVENRCSHLSKPLAGGRLMGYSLICPFHSAQFDIRTGAPLGFPANRPIRRFPVRIERDRVLVGTEPLDS